MDSHQICEIVTHAISCFSIYFACANLLKFSPSCRLKEMNLPQEPYEWYIDLRRHGTVKHAGFGLGFERMILFATGLENIRDAIPFPRYPGKAEL